MLTLFLLALAVCSVELPDTRNMHWAVIAVGSNTYGNYRHQADACHAYQVLLERGMSADRIIQLNYDDAANSPENPFPGTLYNKPSNTSEEAVDVYKGCVIDYRAQAVSKETFMNILKGDKEAMEGVGTGRVLESTEKDNVFVYFVDHGYDGGIIIGARGSEEHLSYQEFNETLDYMYDNDMYNEMVLYIEACNSGSLFMNGRLGDDKNIYALTAAVSTESSWGTYCPPDDLVKGKHMKTCLGDLFSVNFIMDTEQDSLTETLSEQYQIVKKETTKSHPTLFGDLSIGDQMIQKYEGEGMMRKSMKKEDEAKPSHHHSRDRSAVRVPDIPLHLLYYNYLRSEMGSIERQQAAVELSAQLELQMFYDSYFSDFTELMMENNSVAINNSDKCYENAISIFRNQCNAQNEYVYQFYTHFQTACDSIDENAVHEITNSLCLKA